MVFQTMYVKQKNYEENRACTHQFSNFKKQHTRTEAFMKLFKIFQISTRFLNNRDDLNVSHLVLLPRAVT